VIKNLSLLVKHNRHEREPQIPVRKTQSAFLIRTHNETLSVAAMRVSNPDPSPLGINRCDAAPTPSRFAECQQLFPNTSFRTLFASLLVI